MRRLRRSDVHRARRDGHHHGFVKRSAKTNIKHAGQHGRNALVRVRMRRDFFTRGQFHSEEIKGGLCFSAQNPSALERRVLRRTDSVQAIGQNRGGKRRLGEGEAREAPHPENDGKT